MRPSSPKALFAATITAIGVSLLFVGSQDVHGSSCAGQDCESCAFCALATPACISPCPQGCSERTQPADESKGTAGEADDIETAEVSDLGMGLEQVQLSCPIAIDLVTEASDPAPR
jgi:hypothetical protein